MLDRLPLLAIICFGLAFSSVLAQQDNQPRNRNHPHRHLLSRAITQDPSQATNRNFDFIVAGGGLAGLAIARRLSDWSNTTVLVIEAGDDGSDVEERIDTPGFSYLRGLGGSQYDWSYNTTPQADADGLVKQWPRGKGLGGSGAINGMYWTRAGRQDYDAWNALNPGGAQNWGWSEVTRCINKAENYIAPSPSRVSQMGMVIDAAAHGTGGDIQAGYSAYMYEVVAKWIPAWVSLGFRSKDLADGDTHGVTISPLTLNLSNQTRSDSKAGYIDPLPPRDNLVILTRYQVTGLTFNDTTDANGNVVASGIKFQAGTGQPEYTVTANREVILCAGVIGSPQILQLSGIGPKDKLDPLGVTNRVDLPVGYNLQDHISASMYFNTPNDLLTWNRLAQDPNLQAEQLATYRQNRTGMWTFVNAALGYLSMADLLESPQAATTYAATVQSDMAQLLKDIVAWKAFPPDVARGLQDQWRIQQTMIDSNVGQVEILMQLLGNGGNEIGIQIAQQHQWARGTLFIVSNNPFEYPAINPDYFGVGYDIDILNNAVAFARRLAKASPLSDVLLSEKTPGAGVTGEALNNFLKRSAVTGYHPMGTCSMMPRDKGGVVDTNLIVYGTSNVRVIDCSIMPLQISAHLMATGYGIAEKGAEIIQSKYTLQAQRAAISSSSGSSSGSATGAAKPSGASSNDQAGLSGSGSESANVILSSAAIIGIGIGAGVLGVLLLAGLILFCCIKRKKQRRALNGNGWYQPAARSDPGYSDHVTKDVPGEYAMANFQPAVTPYAGSSESINPNRSSASPSINTLATVDLPAETGKNSPGWMTDAAGSGTNNPGNYEATAVQRLNFPLESGILPRRPIYQCNPDNEP